MQTPHSSPSSSTTTTLHEPTSSTTRHNSTPSQPQAPFLEPSKTFFSSKKSTLTTLDSMLLLSKQYYAQHQQYNKSKNSNTNNNSDSNSNSNTSGHLLKIIQNCLQAWDNAIYICVTSIAIDEDQNQNQNQSQHQNQTGHDPSNSELAAEKGYKKRQSLRIRSKNYFGSLYEMIEEHVAGILKECEAAESVKVISTSNNSNSSSISSNSNNGSLQLEEAPFSSEYFYDLHLKSLVMIATLTSTTGNSHKAIGILQHVLNLHGNYPEAFFSMGLAYLFLHEYDKVEFWWRKAVDAQSCNWDVVDQLFSLYTSQNRQKDNVELLVSALQNVDQNYVRKTPYSWWKYLSKLHSLGETYSFLEMYYEASLVYSWLVAIALCDEPLALEDLGLSQRVNYHSLGKVDPQLASLVSSVQPKVTGNLFLPGLIANISTAVVKAEKPVFEKTSAASCDNTQLIFRTENLPVNEINSQLCVVPPRQALLCKYYLLPPLGKIPAKGESPEWQNYLDNITQDNGIRPAAEQEINCDSNDENLNTVTNANAAKTLIVRQNAIDIIVSNALLNLAKLLQDGIGSGIPARIFYINGTVPSQYEILGLYSLSLSLNPNPSIANNIGILLTSEPSQNSDNKSKSGTNKDTRKLLRKGSNPGNSNNNKQHDYALPMHYYEFGLHLDKKNTHIYTNLGSLFRARGEPQRAIKMYKLAVECDPTFNIALTNLASALREGGEIDLSIYYYHRAVECAPSSIEAVSGLANSRQSVCDWQGRGGWGWETMSVDDRGMLVWGNIDGWLPKVVNIVNDQIRHAKDWGAGVIDREIAAFDSNSPSVISQVAVAMNGPKGPEVYREHWKNIWQAWKDQPDEGARVVQLIECALRVCQHRWYMDKLNGTAKGTGAYPRPKIPSGLPVPLSTTVLPFHAFTLPFNPYQVFEIAQRTSIRLSVSSFAETWLPPHVFEPPPPPAPIKNILDKERDLELNNVGKLVVGYISSDFLDHPLSHLMQSVFGLHDRHRFHAICYATSASDGSEYRKKIESECHEFKDVSGMSTQLVVEELQKDGVHILVNLNGFTRGARNDIFAIRPCPIQISLVGFAGSLGGGWCDYLLADKQVIDYPDQVPKGEWVYKEKIIYMPRSFFVCDHRQSALDSEMMRQKNSTFTEKPFRFLEEEYTKTTSQVDNSVAITEKTDPKNPSGAKKVTKDQHKSNGQAAKPRRPELLIDKVLQTPGKISWETECKVRKELRNIIFPNIPKGAFLMGNLNQLYKIDPTTFKVWLSILLRVPNAYLWLLQFPKSGETHLKSMALKWSNGNHSLVDRILFTQIAEKHRHVLRARVCDVFVDTPECNAHTTAADVCWSGTPILTYPRYSYKMCSRIASSIIAAALPDTKEGKKMVSELVVHSDDEYESRGCYFAGTIEGRARLLKIRKTMFEQRETGDFFDTEQWVRNVEKGYRQAWRNWVDSKHEHIYISKD